MASFPPSWMADIAPVLPWIVAIPTVITLLHTLSKDRGVHAQRTRVLEHAKSRMDFWKTRLEIQAKTLEKDKLVAAKEEAHEAIERIRRQTNENLIVLSKSRSPTPVIGLPRWRKLLLLYKPVEGNTTSVYIARTMYLLSLSSLLLYVYWLFYFTYLYFSEPKAVRADDLHAAFHSPVGQQDLVGIIRYSGILLIEIIILFYAARREGPPKQVKEIDEM